MAPAVTEIMRAQPEAQEQLDSSLAMEAMEAAAVVPVAVAAVVAAAPVD